MIATVLASVALFGVVAVIGWLAYDYRLSRAAGEDYVRKLRREEREYPTSLTRLEQALDIEASGASSAGIVEWPDEESDQAEPTAEGLRTAAVRLGLRRDGS